MTDKMISDISYIPMDARCNTVTRNNDVNALRSGNVVEISIHQNSSEDASLAVHITFACPDMAQKAYVAIKQHYGSGRKNNGMLQEAIKTQNVTTQLISTITDRSFATRSPMFCPR